ncbi:MAG: nucleotide-binding protein [Acutalibacteraceae bacterium]|nr:nucleotide-binding protein [Acutalibacteraceae bacterium]
MVFIISKCRLSNRSIVLSDQPDQGLTIIEKFEKYAKNCSYAFALFTPDDIVTNGDKQYFQARPNVIFELGWFYANLGRSRVCILDQASERSKIFSDLQGILRMQFINDVSERYIEIDRELKSLGII